MTRAARQYPRNKKAEAVAAAIASSAVAASKATGIPRRTINDWLHAPEFAELREKTAADLAEGSRIIAHLALDEIMRRLPEFEPRDLTVLYGVMVDKAQLLSGAATSRHEVSLTEGWDDHERVALRDAIRAELARREAEVPAG